jgi:hypothetical protein
MARKLFNFRLFYFAFVLLFFFHLMMQDHCLDVLFSFGSGEDRKVKSNFYFWRLVSEAMLEGWDRKSSERKSCDG